MEIEELIYSVASAYTGITNYVGTRIYPGEKAQDTQPPSINFKSISKRSDPCMGTTPALNRNRMQFDIWAATQDDALKIARQVEACFDRYRVSTPIKVHDTFHLNTINMGLDGELRQFHVAVDMEFNYDEQ